MNIPNTNEWYYLKKIEDGSYGQFFNDKPGSKIGLQYSWKQFKTAEQIHYEETVKAVNQLCNAMLLAFGAALAPVAAEATIVTLEVTGGAPLIGEGAITMPSKTILAERVIQGAAGGISDLVAQKAIDPDKGLNLWSIGANTAGGFFGVNIWTTAAVASSRQHDGDNNYRLSTKEELIIGTIANGTCGAITGAKTLPIHPDKFLGKDKLFVSGANALPGFWSNTTAGVASEKALDEVKNKKDEEK